MFTAFKKRRQVAKLEVVLNIQFIDLKSVDCLAHRWRRRSLEPSRRTPLILIGHRHEPMRDRILMHVIEPGQIRLLISQLRIPEVEPHCAASLVVNLVQLARGVRVKML